MPANGRRDLIRRLKIKIDADATTLYTDLFFNVCVLSALTAHSYD